MSIHISGREGRRKERHRTPLGGLPQSASLASCGVTRHRRRRIACQSEMNVLFRQRQEKASDAREGGRGCSDGRGTSKGQMHRPLSLAPSFARPAIPSRPFETRTPRNPPPRIKAAGRYPPTRSRNPAPPFYPATLSHKLEILKYVRAAGVITNEGGRQEGRPWPRPNQTL